MKLHSPQPGVQPTGRRSFVGMALAGLLTFVPAAGAQMASPTGIGRSQTKQEGQQRGFVLSATFEGSSSRDGQVMDLNTSSGYNFNKHFGLDLGVPFYFVRTSDTVRRQSGSSSTGSGIGNVYADARLVFPNPLLSYGTSFVVGAPTGDKKAGRSTGHWTWNWNNRFDRGFGRFTPFVNAGVGNTIADTRLFHRPFATFGHVAQFEAGTSVDLWGPLSLLVSAYDVAPWGNQTVFSRVVRSSSTITPTTTTSRRSFETTAVTTGGADLTRDNGYNVALDISPAKFIDFEVGYSRSVPLRLDTVSFSVGFNLTEMFHGNRPH